jgi:uncharacterized lipoprotein YddW (UPF0748 family)
MSKPLLWVQLPFLLLHLTVAAQTDPKRECRAAWVATVTNLDWPTAGTSVTRQQSDLIAILDTLRKAGFNTVIFQVRPECDALYISTLEPWSKWLTGSQGTAPSPLWDPLQFAIDETHKRGMELHAWFNPYRAEKSVGNYSLASGHVVNQHPEWILSFARVINGDGSITPALKILDPGLPEVRNHVSRVVSDIVRRYDVDGIHADDYFYPYPPQQITNQDDSTYARYNRGITNRGDWRRDNVNLLMRQIMDSINTIKPYVRFGMSPFGIWKNGVPSGITGLDAYSSLYGDPIAWLRDGSVDYLTPQLYWRIGGNQDYNRLMPWWADSTAAHGRHFYPGHIYGDSYTASELPNQLKLSRANGKVQGEVYFRSALVVSNSLGFKDSLKNNYYRNIALSPVMWWKDTVRPNPPQNIRYAFLPGSGQSAVQWDLPTAASDGDSAYRYVIYRFDHVPAAQEFGDPANIKAVVGSRHYGPPVSATNTPCYYVVTALDRNHNESDLGTLVSITPPGTPWAIAPDHGAAGVSDTQRMIWSPRQPSSLYRLQVGFDSVFAPGLAIDDSLVTDTSYTVSGLKGMMKYYWRVRAGNPAGTSDFSSARSFTTGFPVSPVLIYPESLMVKVAVTPTFRWHSSPEATSYRLQVSTALDFATITIDTAGIADTTVTLGGFALNTIYNWHVKTTGSLGAGAWSGTFRFRTATTAGVADEQAPAIFALEQNYPNPFNPTTSIGYSVGVVGLPAGQAGGQSSVVSSHVRLAVYDLLGREVAVLVDERKQPGVYTATWNAAGKASGVYIYRLTANDYTQSRMMVLLK